MQSQPILMPKLGLTMTEGTLAEWKVAPGDRVAAGDVLFVVETDKISNEIEASEAGEIEALCVVENATVPVGTVVATMLAQGQPESRLASANGDLSAFSPPATEQRRRITPLARRIARDSGVELAAVTGTGPRGRVTADDVIAAAEGRPERQPEPEPSRLAPLSAFQKVTARRMAEAKRDIPHFYVMAEADVTALLDLRGQLNSDESSSKLSVTHFILTALARALVGMPELNRVWAEDGLLEFPQVDIGLAVEGPKGLVAPVLRDLGNACVDDVVAIADQAVERVRSGRVPAQDLQGGATALSNVGMFGATALIPIVNPGHSSILGVGRSQGVFRPDANDRPQFRQVMQLALSCDHRVVDGALAARFLRSIQQHLEAPARLLRRPAEPRT